MSKTEVPQWVIDYNNAGHQSSAGKAVDILMKQNLALRVENEKLSEMYANTHAKLRDLEKEFSDTKANLGRAYNGLENHKQLRSELQKQKELNAELVSNAIDEFVKLDYRSYTLAEIKLVLYSLIKKIQGVMNTDKSSKIMVQIIESERGWGQRIDEVKEFDTYEKALAFVRDYNKDNNESTVPDWYMYAQIVNLPTR
jgi:phage-related minor tail protein